MYSFHTHLAKIRITRTAVVLLSATALTHPTSGGAQQALPGLVVQGATLEPPPVPAAPAPVAKTTVNTVPQTAPPKVAASATAGQTTAPIAAKSTPKPTTVAPAAVPAEPVSGGAATDSTGAADASVSGLAAEKVGSAVSVVTGQDIQRQQIRTAADALRSLPGVNVSQSGTSAGLTQVRIRGAEADHTLVVIDGIQANAGIDGEFDFSDLSADDIERIEVIRGAQSGLYGSSAMGGVINIITKGGFARTGGGALTVTARAEAGSLRTRDVAAGITGNNDRAYVAINGHVRTSNGFNVATVADPNNPGFSDLDKSRLASIGFKAGVKVGDAGQIDVVLKNVSKSGGRDSDGPFDLPGLARAMDTPAFFSSDSMLAGVNLRYDMFGGALTHVFRANRNAVTRKDSEYYTAYGPAFFAPFENRSVTDKAGYLTTYRFATPLLFAAKHSVSGLLEHQWDRFEQGEAATAFSRTALSKVAEYRGEFADRVFVTGSVRHDDNDKFKDFTTWRATAAIALREFGMRPHASAGTGVKLPSMFEQFGAFASFKPNPDLLPEESLSWDAGVEFTALAGRASLDVTYFRSSLSNKIVNDFPSVKNLDGQSLHQGIELAGRLRATDTVSFGVSYTYLSAKDPDGQQAYRRPPHSGRVDASYAYAGGRGTTMLAVTYNGSMRDNPVDTLNYVNVPVTLKDYVLVTAGTAYKLQPGVEVYGRVENLLNQKYQEIYGYNTAGATAFAGVRLTHVVKSLD
jgi:vitamin B12 transporter